MRQCKSLTKNGTQCKRQALPRRRYCWQHESKLVQITLGALVVTALTLIGLAANLAGLGFPIPTFNTTPLSLEIEDVRVSIRGPLWDIEWLNDDEVVVVVHGTGALDAERYRESALVAFWRLASGYETNWHVGRRRVGGNYELALLPPENVTSEEWEFIVGGIECDKAYSGDIAIVLLLISQEAIEESQSEWLSDRNGWGFENLPSDGVIEASQTKTFKTLPVRG